MLVINMQLSTPEALEVTFFFSVVEGAWGARSKASTSHRSADDTVSMMYVKNMRVINIRLSKDSRTMGAAEVYVCACVCVCVREREREGQRTRDFVIILRAKREGELSERQTDLCNLDPFDRGRGKVSNARVNIMVILRRLPDVLLLVTVFHIKVQFIHNRHYTSYIIHHTSYIMHHTSYIIHHTSYTHIHKHTQYLIVSLSQHTAILSPPDQTILPTTSDPPPFFHSKTYHPIAEWSLYQRECRTPNAVVDLSLSSHGVAMDVAMRAAVRAVRAVCVCVCV